MNLDELTNDEFRDFRVVEHQTLIGLEKKELNSEVFTKIKDTFNEVNGEHELVFCIYQKNGKDQVELLETISLTVAGINKMSITEILSIFQNDKRELDDAFMYKSDDPNPKFIKVGGQTEG